MFQKFYGITAMMRRLSLSTILFTLMLTLFWLGPLWLAPGLPNSADGQLHLHRSAAFTRALADGFLWPRWFPEVYQGLGAPVFHYYSPLFYWLTGALHLLTIPLDLAAKLVITLFFGLSALGVMQWIKLLSSTIALPTGRAAGWAAATIYLAHPHFFREYYFQGDYPQLIALLWLPVVLWSFTLLYRENSRFAWLAAVISLALLTLMHNLTLLFGVLALDWYWLGLAWIDRNWRGWWRGVVASLLAASLSAFFWLPALLEARYVQVHNLNEGFFHFAQYFVPLSALLAAPPILDSRAANPPFPHLLGWASWLIIALSILLSLSYLITTLLRRSAILSPRHPVTPSPRHLFWLFWSLLFVLLTLTLTQPWSAPIWEQIFVLRLIQFPGRWLGLAAIGVALLAGILVQTCRPKWQGKMAALLVLVSGVSSAVFLFYQQPFLSIGQISQADTLHYERSSQVWGTTSGNEFLPCWSSGVNPALANQTVEALTQAGMSWQWRSAMSGRLTSPPDGFPSGEITLPLHYFPAWQAYYAGEYLPTKPDEQGRLVVEGANGLAQFDLHWRATTWQWRGQLLSLVALFGLSVLLVRMPRQPYFRGKWVSSQYVGARPPGGGPTKPCLPSYFMPTSRRSDRLPCFIEKIRKWFEKPWQYFTDRRSHLPVRQAQSTLQLSTEQNHAGNEAVAPGDATYRLPFTALLFLLVALLSLRLTKTNWFTQHSPPDRVTGVEYPLSVELRRADQPLVTLLGWEVLAGSRLTPGGQLRLRLYWQRSGDSLQPLHSFVHLYTPASQQSWAIAQNQNPGRISTTNWHRALYYADDLTLTLSPDLPPVTYTLVAGMSDDQAGRLDVAGNGDGLVTLDEVKLAPARPGWRQPLQTEHAAPAMFGSALFLQGYDLLAEPGGPVLRLTWEVRKPVAHDLTIFLHLFDSTGQRLAQFDGPPLQGLLPSSQWSVGALLVDRRKLLLPEGLSPGQYTILVGLYEPQTGVRITAIPEAESRSLFQEDALQIAFTIPK